ncbi:ABC-type nitrate/sulfonate/bicarbonate transport systems periplasmic components-like protein [Syntrophobotulus glycolicus DSM 8271]|uniref:ABC-type nitrate/sulfonate/bicarbonate transport systems periplasmic components-like protein n=1 Tax=Syntrophobotulus glycolicus (strain DSM 8271 / FlGlyR) TaxID=645991 RepID=F0SYI4_SYNGF|nr:ABC transporter substrate-binding protein [Syntrophobotulus glycolicus]ADY57096.1 ABC-type nitrate/sulfonate/bicarbonate transport systems periplasmic components-like protein [Syntrophobotulus glycolicus DSM 8271]
MASGIQKKKFIIIGVVAVILVAGIGVGSYLGQTKKGITTGTEIQGAAGLKDLKSEGYDPATSGKEVITLKTDTKKNCGSTPWVIAEKKGFFAEEGLNIEYTGELTIPQRLPAVLNGTNDIGGAHINALATYIAGGAKIKGVTLGDVDPDPNSDVDPKYRHMRFYANPKLGVTTLAELIKLKNGQPIKINGTEPNCTTFIADNAFDHLGFNRDQIQYVVFDTDTAALQAAQQGNIDIVGVHPPFYKLAADSKLPQIFDTADTGLGAAAGSLAYYFREDFIKENPEGVARFVRAIKKAQAWSVKPENAEEAIRLTADYIGQPVNAVHYYYSGKGFPDELIQPWIDDLERNGFLKKGQLTVNDLITKEFDN